MFVDWLEDGHLIRFDVRDERDFFGVITQVFFHDVLLNESDRCVVIAGCHSVNDAGK